MLPFAPRSPFHPPRRTPEVQCYDAPEEFMATTTRRVATEEDLLAMPEDGNKYVCAASGSSIRTAVAPSCTAP